MQRRSYRVSFPGGSGYELAGIIDYPEPSDPLAVAVFSHCFTCNKDLKAIVRISRALAEQGIAVLRYDMTGLGGSQGDFSETNFTTNLADLKAAIAHASHALGPVTALLGHSFGGAASLAVAAEATSAAPSLAALATLAAPSDTQHLASLLVQMDPAIEHEGVGSVSIGGLNWQIHHQMIEDFRRHDLTSLLPKISVPTLLLHSPVDATVHFDHALRIMGLIQNAPKERQAAVSLMALDQADHLLAENPSDIAYVAEVLAAFIKRNTGSFTD